MQLALPPGVPPMPPFRAAWRDHLRWARQGYRLHQIALELEPRLEDMTMAGRFVLAYSWGELLFMAITHGKVWLWAPFGFLSVVTGVVFGLPFALAWRLREAIYAQEVLISQLEALMIDLDHAEG